MKFCSLNPLFLAPILLSESLFIKPSSRYNTYDSRSSTTSSHFFDPSSFSEFDHKSFVSSRALVNAKPSGLIRTRGSIGKSSKTGPSLTTMVKKFMEKKSALTTNPKFGSNQTAAGLLMPADFIADDLKKNAWRGTGLSALQNKLYGKPSSKKTKGKEVKDLTEVKRNTGTLAMVLQSERELLNMNKETELEIADLKLFLEEKNKEM